MNHGTASNSLNLAADDELQLIGAVLEVLGWENPPALPPEVLQLEPEDFSTLDHARIWESIETLMSRSERVDIVTINRLMRAHGYECSHRGGWIRYLSSAVVNCATPRNLAHWAKLAKQEAGVRRYRRSVAQVKKLVQEDFSTAEEFHAAVLSSLPEPERTERESTHISSAIKATLREMMENFERGSVARMTTGIEQLDRMIVMRPGEVHVIAARPSMGKTALGLQMASRAALDLDLKVAIISLEMRGSEVFRRIVANKANVDMALFDQPLPSKALQSKLFNFEQELLGKPFHLVDRVKESSISDAKAQLRSIAGEVGGLEVVMVDYLQLMRSAERYQGSRVEQVGEVSREMKALAKELDCVVLLLSQLSRGPEGRENKRPELSDLRGSGEIEQDADTVTFIYRPGYYSREADSADDTAELLVRKNRNGKVGVAITEWSGRYQRFSDRKGY